MNRKVAEVSAKIEKYATILPPSLMTVLRDQVKKLQDAVDNFNNQLPTIQLPSGPQIPLATILPAANNFDFSTVSQIIGKPGDKFNILDIPSYINGSDKFSFILNS